MFDDDGAFGGVEVVEGEAAKFSGAEAAGVEQLEHSAVAEAFGGGGVRRVDQGVDLWRGDEVFG